MKTASPPRLRRLCARINLWSWKYTQPVLMAQGWDKPGLFQGLCFILILLVWILIQRLLIVQVHVKVVADFSALTVQVPTASQGSKSADVSAQF